MHVAVCLESYPTEGKKLEYIYPGFFCFLKPIQMHSITRSLIFPAILLLLNTSVVFSLGEGPKLQYTVSILQPATHTYAVELRCSNWKQDSIHLKMPQWMPGYYQLMNYAKGVEQLKATDGEGKNIVVERSNDNTWILRGIKSKPFVVSYSVVTKRQFVANSYVDSAYAISLFRIYLYNQRT